MAYSQWPALQALGWAMLNSLWQMAFLFGAYVLVGHVLRLLPSQKYLLAVSSLLAGCIWFAHSFYTFYTSEQLWIFDASGFGSARLMVRKYLSITAAVYFVVLLIPAYRLFQSWRYIGHLKKFGLEKTGAHFRLFVAATSRRLGIKRNVHVYLSRLVQTPVTIGFLKPVILLPFAVFNELTLQQAEAVLLHELSHIRYYDFVVNLIVTMVHTVFYFNPFVRKFVSAIEFEREARCDALVLQFQYDKLSYASALLALEKRMHAPETLTIAAAGEKHLLRRVQTIVGMKPKPDTNLPTSLLFASACLVLFIGAALLHPVQKRTSQLASPTFIAFENPLYQRQLRPAALHRPAPRNERKTTSVVVNEGVFVGQPIVKSIKLSTRNLFLDDVNLIPAAFDFDRQTPTAAEQKHITNTLATTRMLLEEQKWREIEDSIGDAMTLLERLHANQDYLTEVQKIDWQQMYNRMTASYEAFDWRAIESKLSEARTNFKLDSTQDWYIKTLKQLNTESRLDTGAGSKNLLALPDTPVAELKKVKVSLQLELDSIKNIRRKKVIHF